ncbi:acetoin utilization deacetylase AcuC-like enzyme [Marinirhabdus gelatinilytica]|uniref:Acetoin utilization deacetylase AcuC-like enzyme n=2 Tax=Marinirhabdus gelatinilytica TaxID=1703343 RepID=A0A370QJ29_9FLAO|nr:acetoin utilization deacetylase AcuC-like enzyme [Marinirhabdus gelatinilytica]
MAKYNLLPGYLLKEGICTQENFFEPEKIPAKIITQVHTRDYYNRLLDLKLDKKEIRKIGFPLRADLVDRGHYIIGGTIKGCHFAIENGVSLNIAGGTHHAYADRGEAFCLLNDQAVAAQYLLDTKKASKILIIDLDVHQGNGTAKIFEHNPYVFTFSMHGAKNYPFKKEKSDLDIGLDDGTGDEEYLEILKNTLPKLIEKVQPDFIFYLSGVDIIKGDKLGRLACTLKGCKHRDRFVFETAKNHDIPVQVSMGGGYAPAIDSIIEAHANTYKMAQEVYFSWQK